jgi:integrase/recombinase XerD
MADRNDLCTTRMEHACVGPLSDQIEGFSAFLAREGYARETVRAKIYLLTDLSRWLDRRQLHIAQFDEEQLKTFQLCRVHRGFGRRGDGAAGRQLLTYLRSLGCIAARAEQTDESPRACIERDYERFLAVERGLAASTSTDYRLVIQRFLLERFGDAPLRFDELGLPDIHRFILQEVRRAGRGHGKRVITALRSFLRFLQQRGAIAADLAAAVPTVASWRLSHLPKSLPPEQVKRLLMRCDRKTPAGQRDYAILLLLARLGLRAGEVLALTLDDISWERGEFVVRGKSKRLERLPLPREVGAALVRYLRRVRPACATRRVFVRMRAPQRGFLGPSAICCVVRRALKRAGLDPAFKGAHLLRHSLATNLLRRGASLSEIGQLLRHCQPTTTQIYAKVDIKALRGIARPWLGGAS